MISDRAVGALLGQAVGDALGFRYQYRSGEDVTNQICMDKDNSGFLPIRGSAVFDFPPGQVCSFTVVPIFTLNFHPFQFFCLFV
ncbi:unnamed protein product [Anisakis simplex]|uniref:ADP-ribosylglycohydrolase n=1 Tax=Anisakis simplex TaxID=6269 RepID=A0A0M3KDF7_ANISI|nr:unnamed protein product [Anisakis simplex]